MTGSPRCSTWSSSPPPSAPGAPTSSPAASSSASPSPVRWRPGPPSSCSTSRSPPSTRALRGSTARAVRRALRAHQHHRPAGHPRPERGTLPRRPGRRDARRSTHPVGHPQRGLPLPERPRRWPSSSAAPSCSRAPRRPTGPPAPWVRSSSPSPRTDPSRWSSARSRSSSTAPTTSGPSAPSRSSTTTATTPPCGSPSRTALRSWPGCRACSHPVVGDTVHLRVTGLVRAYPSPRWHSMTLTPLHPSTRPVLDHARVRRRHRSGRRRHPPDPPRARRPRCSTGPGAGVPRGAWCWSRGPTPSTRWWPTSPPSSTGTWRWSSPAVATRRASRRSVPTTPTSCAAPTPTTYAARRPGTTSTPTWPSCSAPRGRPGPPSWCGSRATTSPATRLPSPTTSTSAQATARSPRCRCTTATACRSSTPTSSRGRASCSPS